MAAQPVLHVLDRVDYSKHRLVTMPSDTASALGPSSIRIQTKVLGLTTNNLTYARMGHLLGWWDVYALPARTPEPYSDAKTYGRISGWGYAEILESTDAAIPAGHTIFGYLPIGTLPEDLQVEHTQFKDRILVRSAHRQHLWKIYNQYQVCAPLEQLVQTGSLDALGWDTVQAIFGTGYNLNAYAFAWNDENRIHPGGKPGWTAQDASLDDATVVVLSASGKTALSFAHQVRRNRPREHQPRTLIGVGSAASQATIERSGCYDRVMLYSDEQAAKAMIEKDSPRRVVLIDFGGREGARARWRDALSASAIPFQLVLVGGEVKAHSPMEVIKNLGAFADGVQLNASEIREKGIETGGQAYFDDFHAEFDKVKRAGGLPGLHLEWHSGMESWAEGWEKLAKDQVPSDVLLVYQL